MDEIDEVVASGPPGWRVSQVIRQWPVEIEMISCLVEKEEDGQSGSTRSSIGMTSRWNGHRRSARNIACLGRHGPIAGRRRLKFCT